MKCKKCGFDNNDTDMFCTNCGAPLNHQEGIKCPKCGNINREGALHCNNCGAVLASRVKPTKNKKLIIGLLCGALILGGGIGGYFFLHKGKSTKDYPTIIAEAQDYLNNCDYDQAISKYLEAIKIDPKQVDPYLELSNLYAAEGDYEHALDILNQAQKSIGEDNEEINNALSNMKQYHMTYQDLQMYKSYYKALNDLENTYGSAAIEENNIYYNLTGAFYAQLLDLDNDDMDDLIVYSKDSNDEFVLDIFSYDQYKDETIHHTYNGDDYLFFSTFKGYFVETAQKDDRDYIQTGYVYESEEAYSYYALDENKDLVCIQKFNEGYGSYTIDDKDADFDTYKNTLSAYEITSTFTESESKSNVEETMNSYESCKVNVNLLVRKYYSIYTESTGFEKSEDELKEIASKQGKYLVSFMLDEYDYMGTGGAFAVLSDSEDTSSKCNLQVYYIYSYGKVVKVETKCDTYQEESGRVESDGNTSFFTFTSQDDSSIEIYGVKDDKPYRLSISDSCYQSFYYSASPYKSYVTYQPIKNGEDKYGWSSAAIYKLVYDEKTGDFTIGDELPPLG